MRVAEVGCCVLDLRLLTGTVRVTASAACAGAPRSVAVFNLCIAVTGAELDTVRVVHDQVVDIVVEIRVSLSVVATVAVLLVQVLVCTEPRCRECVQENGLQLAVEWTMIQSWSAVWKLCVAEFFRCLARLDVSLELCGWRCWWWPSKICSCWCRSVDECAVGVALHDLFQRSDEVIEVLQILPPSRVVSLHFH